MIAGTAATTLADEKRARTLPAAQHSWTGFYVGINAGITSAQTRGFDHLAILPNQVEDNRRGFAAGGQVGINWQFSPHWVIGVEADFGRLGIDRSSTLSFEYVTSTKAGDYRTLRARLGYAAGPSLIYVTGGAATVSISEEWNFLGNPFLPLPPERHSSSIAAHGWAGGTGIETMLGPILSARAEYLYINAGPGKTHVIHAETTEPIGMRLYHQFHVFRFGLNARFGPDAHAPVADANWNGAYVGLNAGLGTSLTEGYQTNGGATGIATISNNGAGFTGGIQGGYNWQIGRVVVGVEADINRLNIDHGYMRTPAGQVNFEVTHSWFGTARGRVGYAIGPALIYATGGVGFADVKNTMDFNGTVGFASTDTRRAPVAAYGGGIEAALSREWSAKLEYLNVDVAGSPKVSDGGSIMTFRNDFQVFRFGINHRWQQAPLRIP